jgi:hypothetical protein
MDARRAASVALFAFAVGCKPSASVRTDAGADARVAGDAGSVDASAGSGAAVDASTTQDEALPAATSDELTLRAQHLFEAIQRDNPDLASDILFPRDAFVLAHDATDPGRVWDGKLSTSFRHGIHAMNRRTKGIEHAQFVSFEIGRTVTESSVRHHEWKIPLWRVPHARLNYTLDGRTSRFEIGELTSWRGAWYVTKLR